MTLFAMDERDFLVYRCIVVVVQEQVADIGYQDDNLPHRSMEGENDWKDYRKVEFDIDPFRVKYFLLLITTRNRDLREND